MAAVRIAVASLAIALVVSASATAARPRCPASDSHPLAAHGSSTALVRGTPRAVLLCRYGAAPGALVGARDVTDRAVTRRIARRLDALRPLSAGATACPVDDGSEIVARFRHPASTIVIHLRGCRLVTNGRSERQAMSPPGPRLIRQLESLV